MTMDDLHNMLYPLHAGRENDLRDRIKNLERIIASSSSQPSRSPTTNLGVDENGLQRVDSDNIDLLATVGTASGLEINWWLPLTLADDDVTHIFAQAFQTISGVNYLYVGGQFNRIGGVAALNVARYNFSTRQWEAVNGGVNTYVRALAFSPAGVLYIGGSFHAAGGDALADFLAKDNAGAWANVNGGGLNSYVYTIAFDSAGVLYIGGEFTNAGGDALADYVAKDNAGAWANVNGGVNWQVYKIAFAPDGTLYIVGTFTNAGGDALADKIAKDNAGAWANVNGGVNDFVRDIVWTPDGTLHIIGAFTNAGGDALADYVAKDNAGAWVNVGGGLNNTGYAMTLNNDGNIVVGGTFTDAGGFPDADRIAWFDGENWQAYSNGGGLSGLGGYVYSVVIDADTGTVYAGGDFNTAGTIKCDSIAAFVKPLADALDMISGLFEQYSERAAAVYAPIAKGVTGGDAHDHNGGDGVQIDHVNLANIGTNNHAAIDTHLALPRWTTVRKAADGSRQSNTVVAADTDLTFGALAGKTYAVRGRIWFATPAAADFKFRFAFAGTSLLIHEVSIPCGSVTETVGIETTTPATTTISCLGAGTSGGYVEFDGQLVCDASNRAFQLQWAQVTSTASNTTVKAGSYIEYMLMN